MSLDKSLGSVRQCHSEFGERGPPENAGLPFEKALYHPQHYSLAKSIRAVNNCDPVGTFQRNEMIEQPKEAGDRYAFDLHLPYAKGRVLLYCTAVRESPAGGG